MVEVNPTVKRAMSRFKKSKSFKEKYIPGWKELDEFYRSEQYKSSNLPPWVPKPVTNYLHLVVTTKRAALAGENPMAMLRPLSAEDMEPVAQLQKIYEWVWKKIKIRNVLRDNIETSKLLGTAIAQIYWDENTGVMGGTGTMYEGEIRSKEIDVMNFHVDPNAYRLEDAAWCHVTEKRNRKELEKEFGVSLTDAETQEDNYGEEYNRDYYRQNDKEDAQIDFHAHYERYWNTDKMPVPQSEQPQMMNPLDMPDPSGMSPMPGMPDPSGMPQQPPGIPGMPEQPMSQDPNMPPGGIDPTTGTPVGPQGQPPIEQATEQIPGQEMTDGEEIGGWKYKVTYIAGGKILKTIDPLEPNMYPFAVLYDFKQRQEFWGKGTGSLIIDNQKLINKVEGIIAMIGTLLQNPQKIVSKRSGINPLEAMKYSYAPGHTWVTNEDPANSMKWQDVPQIPQALVNLADMAKENIRQITGLNEAYMGQSVGSLQTSGGVNSLIDRATMRDKDQMYDIEQYVEQLTRIIIGFITTKYTDERYIRIIADPTKPDSSTSFQKYVGTGYAGIEFDLDIDVSSHAPITQARRESELTDLMQLQGQYNYMPKVITPQEYIKGKRMVDADKIIARMNKEEEQNKLDMLNQVAQMMGEAMTNGIPMEEIMSMAQSQLQSLESGEAPMDPNAAAMGAGGTGSAADNQGAMQSQQAGM